MFSLLSTFYSMAMLHRFLNFLILQSILAFNNTFIQEIIDDVKVYSDFDTILVINPDDWISNYPQIMLSRDFENYAYIEPLNIIFSENTEDLRILTRNLSSDKVLVISNNSQPEMFLKFKKLQLRNVVLYNGSLRTFQTCNPFTSEVFEIARENIFKNNGPLNFEGSALSVDMDYHQSFCDWEFCEILRIFAVKYNFTVTFKASEMPDFYILPEDEFESWMKTKYFEYYYVTITIPIVKNSQKSEDFILPFSTGLWRALVGTIFYFGIALAIAAKMECQRFDLTHGMLQALGALLGKTMEFHSKKTLVSLMFLAIVTFGFMISTIYTLFIGSFLILDQKETDFEIICSDEMMRFLRKDYPFIESNFRFHIVSTETYFKMVGALNTNFGYCMYSDMWKSDFGFQGALGVNLYRLLDEWKAGYLPYYGAIKDNVIFREEFDKFFVKMYYYGFKDKFGRVSMGAYFRKLKELHVQLMDSNIMLVLEDFKYPLKLYLGGMLVAGLIFLYEICFK